MKAEKKRRGKDLVFVFVLLLGGLLGFFTFYIFFAEEEVLTPPSDALYKDQSQSIDVRVADLLRYMTLKEKIGQMALVEKNSIQSIDDISEYNLGGLLSGSGAKPEENTKEGWREMIDAFQAEANASRLGIPLLYGTDAIHGHAHVPGATVFPHAIGLGATANPELVEAVAEATAQELSATGANWNFAPNLDLPKDMRWGRVYEAFSDDSKLVSTLGVAYLQGLQNAPGHKVLGTLKHYVGLGSMGWNTSTNKNFKIDQGVTLPDEEALAAHFIPPFKAAIDAGALSVMVGLNTWGDTKMVLQKKLLTDVLRDELGFKGFTVSDWYGVHEGRKNIFGATVASVNAGVDMLMLPFDYKTFVRHMKIAHALGLVSEDRINEAAGRILYAKFAIGLFDDAAFLDATAVGNDEHKALAREAVARSLVLLKNDEVLPIPESVSHIRVAGSAADNVGMQMGAWSIEWQGIDGNWMEGAQSILAGIEAHAGEDTLVEYDLNGVFDDSRKAPVGIAVVGEKPYAEGWGDKEFPILSSEDRSAIAHLQQSCEKVVVVIVSGRPLFIENEIESFDALVEAWLPGSEGGGVADVLFGAKPFVGTLPVAWPLRSQQLPLGLDGETADGTPVLFARGYGLQK